MKIVGIEDMSAAQLNNELRESGKFVTYRFCISVIIMTFKRSSNIYFIRDGESAFAKGFKFTLLSFFLGWWGFPWGPIHTIGSIITNCKGGQDVTQEVINMLNESNTEAEV